MSEIDYTSKVLIWGQPGKIGEFLRHSLKRFGLQIRRRETTPGLDVCGETWEVAECLSELGIDTDQAQPGDTMARLELSEYVDDDLISEVSHLYPNLTFHSAWVAWAWDESRDECGAPWRLCDEGGLTARAGFPT